MVQHAAASTSPFAGMAAAYAAARPHPPTILGELLPHLAQTPVPSLVVDIGCGPGLSTRFWANNAAQVVGIEPVPEMCQEAIRQTTAPHIAYRAGTGEHTGLPTGCADIVTCAQALHWMEPQPTFAEVARITRPGGVFAAYDYEVCPTVGHWEVQAAHQALHARATVLEHRLAQGTETLQRAWTKAEHLARMQASGCFRYTQELLVHQRDRGNADRLLRLVRTHSSVAQVLKLGLRDADLGLEAFETLVRQTLGETLTPWYWSYRVRIGIV